MKLRLFAIRDTQTNTVLPEPYFGSKDQAKKQRDLLNEDDRSKRYVVTPGPDHHGWKGPKK